jgi:penicillin-binding protein 2
MSIGQGFTLVTPLQMANMISMIVNDGPVYKPHVLKEIRDPVTGAIEKNSRPEVLHQSSLPPEIFETVRRDMRGVIMEGTAQYPLNLRSVQIAGKTGTAEVGFPDRWHSWFAAFAPFDNYNDENAIVVSVIVEAANKWEWWAPYASALIFQGYFANQTYEQAVNTLGFQYLVPVQGRRE